MRSGCLREAARNDDFELLIREDSYDQCQLSQGRPSLERRSAPVDNDSASYDSIESEVTGEDYDAHAEDSDSFSEVGEPGSTEVRLAAIAMYSTAQHAKHTAPLLRCLGPPRRTLHTILLAVRTPIHAPAPPCRCCVRGFVTRAAGHRHGALHRPCAGLDPGRCRWTGGVCAGGGVCLPVTQRVHQGTAEPGKAAPRHVPGVAALQPRGAPAGRHLPAGC